MKPTGSKKKNNTHLWTLWSAVKDSVELALQCSCSYLPSFHRRSKDAGPAVMLTLYTSRKFSRWWGVTHRVPDTHLDLRAEMQWCGQWVTSSLKDTGLGRRRGELWCRHTAEIETTLGWTEWAPAADGWRWWPHFLAGTSGHVWAQGNDHTYVWRQYSPYIMVCVRHYCLPVVFVKVVLFWVSPI